MATSIPDGPLDDYFRDEGDETVSRNMVNEMNDDGSESGDITLVNTLPPSVKPVERGWTGVLPNVPSSSVPSTPPIPTPGKITDDSSSSTENTFAERFKYLICSSGLLEKDYVPGLSGEELVDEVEGEEKDRWAELQRWVEKGKERWDLVLAGLALLLGITLLWSRAGLILVIALGLGVFFGVNRMKPSSNLVPPTSPPSLKSQALGALTTFISQTHTLNTTLHTSLNILQPHPSSLNTHHSLRVGLHRLTDNMTDHLATATSTLLELTDRKELGVLGEMYDIPVVGSFFYTRRTHNDELSDQGSPIASPRGPQIPSPRHSSLPARDAFTPSAKPRRFTTSTRPMPISPVSHAAPTFERTHSHRTQHLSLASATDADDRFTALPQRTPRLSKRASLDKLRDTWRAARSEQRPKHERRITEADEEGDSWESSEGDKSMDDDVERTVRKKTPESETIEEVPKLPVTPTTPVIEKLRGTSSPFKRVSSPLARRFSQMSEGGMMRQRPASPEVSLGGQTPSGLLPSPFEHDLSSTPLRSSLSLDPAPNPKRRSLQNMPYYPASDDELALPSAGLTRTQSMPFSDLQALRTASSTGSRSRRSSFNPGYQMPGSPLGIGFPNSFPPDKRSSLGAVPIPSPRPLIRRVESVSPLTTPALTASCLGVHLKRRRMACCLLGLRFDTADEAYWKDVKESLEAMTAAMVSERELLEVGLREAEKEALLAQRFDGLVKSGSEVGWSPAESTFPFSTLLDGGGKDFAPRTNDEAVVLEQVDKIGATLIKAWSDLAIMREKLRNAELRNESGTEAWSKVRERLGDMVRDWERGREALVRIESGRLVAEEDIQEDPSAQGTHADLPAFIKAWEESSRDTSLETARTAYGDDIDGIDTSTHDTDKGVEVLPPAGRDTIFESDSISLPQSDFKARLGQLSRAERIALMKEAREKGTSVEILLRGDEAVVDTEGEMRKKGGEMVDELRGVIGVIRKMKGEGGGEETQLPAGSGEREEGSLNGERYTHIGNEGRSAYRSIELGTLGDRGAVRNGQGNDNERPKGSDNDNDDENECGTKQLDRIVVAREGQMGNGFGLDLDELKKGFKLPNFGALERREEGQVFE
ncbi:hypothetical protein CI109_103976 [Kwoniella shandongensis]|uniref:Uncharacterized protein n=1 Tax=Kwoniella shandongensis TaxID=1734106 RepID=A0A5M6BYY6_9TREE|nr:uncharacterized protein CI109_004140 [Kwoniella shandongensis]KAA5527601.1 hypothetical protein CI109_004140 [Kwoniella shandongensis]